MLGLDPQCAPCGRKNSFNVIAVRCRYASRRIQRGHSSEYQCWGVRHCPNEPLVPAKPARQIDQTDTRSYADDELASNEWGELAAHRPHVLRLDCNHDAIGLRPVFRRVTRFHSARSRARP